MDSSIPFRLREALEVTIQRCLPNLEYFLQDLFIVCIFASIIEMSSLRLIILVDDLFDRFLLDQSILAQIQEHLLGRAFLPLVDLELHHRLHLQRVKLCILSKTRQPSLPFGHLVLHGVRAILPTANY